MSQTIQNPTYKYINKSTLPVYTLILKRNGMKQVRSKSWIWDVRFVRESLYLENMDQQWYCELINQVWSPLDPVLNVHELRVFKFYTDAKNTPTKCCWYDVYVSQPVVVSMGRMFGVWGDGRSLTRKSPSFAIREGRGYPALTILSHDWCNHGNDDRWHTLMQLRSLMYLFSFLTSMTIESSN